MAWPAWNGALLNLDSGKERKSLNRLERLFFITVMNCLRQGSHKDFGVVMLGRNLGFFMIVTGR